jgi:hypothetical protein
MVEPTSMLLAKTNSVVDANLSRRVYILCGQIIHVRVWLLARPKGINGLPSRKVNPQSPCPHIEQLVGLILEIAERSDACKVGCARSGSR